jgi:hypothetical protein
MTQNDVINDLEQQYQIVSTINLIEFDTVPTGRLYTCVRQARKTCFADNERIVVLAPKGLQKTYADQPHDIIVQLEKYLQHHDISHYFIVVVTNIDSLPNELAQVHELYNPHELHKLQCRFYQ